MSSNSADNVGQMNLSTNWTRNDGDHPLQSAWSFWYDKKQNKKQQTK